MGHGANYRSKSNPEFQTRWVWVMAGAGVHGVKASLGEKKKANRAVESVWKLLEARDTSLSSGLMEESKPFKDARGGSLYIWLEQSHNHVWAPKAHDNAKIVPCGLRKQLLECAGG